MPAAITTLGTLVYVNQQTSQSRKPRLNNPYFFKDKAKKKTKIITKIKRKKNVSDFNVICE